jgi:hypothetical protein
MTRSGLIARVSGLLAIAFALVPLVGAPVAIALGVSARLLGARDPERRGTTLGTVAIVVALALLAWVALVLLTEYLFGWHWPAGG